MKVLIATPEATPFVKTGGLADVTGALAKEYQKMGVDVALVLPLYKRVRENFRLRSLKRRFTVPLGGQKEEGSVWYAETDDEVPAYFIENNKFFDRDELYGTPDGDFPDNASRFIFYSRGILEACKAIGIRPDIIHCNDWQSGLVPVYLKTLYKTEFKDTAALITIHNLGYQGLFWHLDMPLTGLGWEFFNMENLEFYGKINLLKAGIVFSDIVTTVSKTYAKEILTEQYGFGLHGVLKKRQEDLYGIVNGIDYSEWNPEDDTLLPANYSISDMDGKAQCKKALQKELNLKGTLRQPIIGIVSRLSAQKGLDLIAEAIKKVLALNARVVILGKGDEPFHQIFKDIGEKNRGGVSVTIGFDNALAHKIYAGSDMFLMPSRYEPCGLGQLIALRYGSIPVVRRTGGLADTVIEFDLKKGSGNGFLFKEYSHRALLRAISTAVEFYSSKRLWHSIIKNSMEADFSWGSSARQYIALYEKAIKKVRG